MSRMRRLTVVLGFFVANALADPPPGYKLAWSDEFNGTTLDPLKWAHSEPGKVRRHATNVPEAVTVGDGKLTITTYTENGKHFTGMVSTQNLYERAFGYWEARIAFSSAPGMWSAFWSLSPTMGNPVDDPRVAGMEIDFAEHRSHDNDGRKVDRIASHALHWNGYGPKHQSDGKEAPDMNLGTGFHIYACEWTESEYRFYVNGQLTWRFAQHVSQRPQFVILSSEVESGLWSMDIPKGGYANRATSTTQMVVDYVRHYVNERTGAQVSPFPRSTLGLASALVRAPCLTPLNCKLKPPGSVTISRSCVPLWARSLSDNSASSKGR